MGSSYTRRGLTASVGLLALLLAWPMGVAYAGCQPDSIELRSASGVARFGIEVADTAGERAQGLMNRPAMARSAGMLFVYEQPQHAVFWMKNTLIPLDMVFADATGRVTRVHSDAIPHDETPIDGGAGVLYVLEINGGLAKRLGLTEGSMMRHPLIAQSTAVWPCEAE